MALGGLLPSCLLLSSWVPASSASFLFVGTALSVSIKLQEAQWQGSLSLPGVPREHWQLSITRVWDMSTYPPVSVACREEHADWSGCPMAPPPGAGRSASAYPEPQDQDGQRGVFPEVSLLLALQSNLGADGGRETGHTAPPPPLQGHVVSGSVSACPPGQPGGLYSTILLSLSMFGEEGCPRPGSVRRKEAPPVRTWQSPPKSLPVGVGNNNQMKMVFEYNYKYECSAQFFPKYWMDFFFKDAIALRSLVHFNFY